MSFEDEIARARLNIFPNTRAFFSESTARMLGQTLLQLGPLYDAFTVELALRNLSAVELVLRNFSVVELALQNFSVVELVLRSFSVVEDSPALKTSMRGRSA